MPAGLTNTDSMFSVRQTPWHGLGAVLDRPPATITEAIELSGLDRRVEREPIAVDRHDPTISGTPRHLGVTSGVAGASVV